MSSGAWCGRCGGPLPQGARACPVCAAPVSAGTTAPMAGGGTSPMPKKPTGTEQMTPEMQAHVAALLGEAQQQQAPQGGIPRIPTAPIVARPKRGGGAVWAIATLAAVSAIVGALVMLLRKPDDAPAPAASARIDDAGWDRLAPAVASVSRHAAGHVEASGTGFFVDEKGLLVTARALVVGETHKPRLEVKTSDKSIYRDVTCIDVAGTDLMLLRIAKAPTQTLRLGAKGQAPEPGPVVVLAHDDAGSYGVKRVALAGVGASMELTPALPQASAGAPVFLESGAVIAVLLRIAGDQAKAVANLAELHKLVDAHQGDEGRPCGTGAPL